MEFIILKNTEVTFPSCTNEQTEGNLKPRLSTPLQARIQITKKEDGTTNAYYASVLTSAILENPWTLKGLGDVANWDFTVAISLPNPTTTGYNGQEEGPSISSASEINEAFCMKILQSAPGSSSFVRVIQNFITTEEDEDGEEPVIMKVLVKKFGEKGNSTLNWPSIILKAEDHGEFSSDDFSVERLVTPPESTLLSWKAGREFSGIFTISVVFNCTALNILHSINLAPNERYNQMKMLLENKVCTDTEILVGISPNQKAIKCHRAFLVAGSSVFQKMFESGLKEARENKIEMEGISESGVRALLAYLYHSGVKAAFQSSEIALELLQAVEKYDIADLGEAVREIILAKGSSWFDVDMVVSLYMFAKNLCPDEEGINDEEPMDEDDQVQNDSDDSDDGSEDGGGDGDVDEETENVWEAVKVKALKVLKWYTQKMPKALLESVKYQEVFSGNPKMGMEIYSGILRLK